MLYAQDILHFVQNLEYHLLDTTINTQYGHVCLAVSTL